MTQSTKDHPAILEERAAYEATIARLQRELAEARAETAAVVDRVTVILKGIDLDECENSEGWWETSAGVAFGKDILRKIAALSPTAALDRIKAEAELAGWKRGRDDAAGVEFARVLAGGAYDTGMKTDPNWMQRYLEDRGLKTRNDYVHDRWHLYVETEASIIASIRALPTPSPVDLAARLGGEE